MTQRKPEDLDRRGSEDDLGDDEQATGTALWEEGVAADAGDPPPEFAEDAGPAGISEEVAREARRGERDAPPGRPDAAEEDAVHITRRP